MPEYNLNFSDIGNFNVDMGLDPENFFKSDVMNPPSDVMRYPLKAIEKEQDMLLIRIFDQLEAGDVFGIDNIVAGDWTKTTVTNTKTNEIISEKTSVSNVTGINALPTKNQLFNEAGKSLKKNARYIWLPIPQSVSDSISVGYAEDTLNPLQAAGMALGADAIKDPVKAAGKVMDILKGIGGLKLDDSTTSALQTSLAGNAINQLGANVNPQSLITRSSGQILQSNLELLFDRPTLRSFPFTFDFTPREPAEAEMVKKIIRTIKKATVPKRGNGVFINSPDLFQFQYVAGGERQHPFLNRFKVGVIENVSVDYTASGTYATYSDRTPVHIRMTLAFKEINPIYMEDYDDAASEGAEGPGIHGVGY
jgi:hypothetical protein